MTGAKRAAQVLGQCRYPHDSGIFGAERVHRFDLRHKEQVRIRQFQSSLVHLQRAWILREIRSRLKLGWIYEDRDNHTFSVLTREFYETEMAIVQVAHGRNQSDVLAAVPPFSQMLAKLGCLCNDLHTNPNSS